jgi:hypothetical protein
MLLNKMTNRYDKMEDYVGSVFNVFQLINRKAEHQQDKRMKIVSLVKTTKNKNPDSSN